MTRRGDVLGGGDVFVVLQPAKEGSEALEAALLAEGARLARELGRGAGAVEIPDFELSSVGTVARSLAGLVSQAQPTLLLMLDTDGSRELAPLVAHALGTQALLGCTSIVVEQGEAVFRRPVYGGWLEEDVSYGPGRAEIASLAAEVMFSLAPPAERASAVPLVATIESRSTAEELARRLELVPPDFRTVDLTHARRIVSAGMGSANPELLPLVQELAELLEASVGTTRPVVDEGTLPKERLIGQTGRTVRPDLYVSLGVSGSPHHVAGVQEPKRFFSVSRDARAPVFQFSDAGYLGDLRALLPGLVTRIRDWRDGREE